jgi:group I intron endonuclease
MSSAKIGKSHSAETKTLLSEINKGKNFSAETKAKMSEARGTKIYLYSSDGTSLINTFPSAIKAAETLNISKDTIRKYAKSQELFKEKWIFSTIPR